MYYFADKAYDDTGVVSDQRSPSHRRMFFRSGDSGSASGSEQGLSDEEDEDYSEEDESGDGGGGGGGGFLGFIGSMMKNMNLKSVGKFAKDVLP